ncbi:MAG: hypothetical protein L0387_35465 [Acidobacteria bacterium]|nr:hypothetical protein [Acidobacteriota bacterium]MCI0720224.1 hypothetical protein [Acidobacteriota bacterium]
MPARHLGLVAAFWLVALLFVYGGVRLFQFRFETGDIYAEYSSLRSDPLGARALYQSLERIDSLKVSRNLSPLSRLPLDRKHALIIAGFKYSYGLLENPNWLQPIEHLLGSGSRIVICFYPHEGHVPTAKLEQKGATKREDDKDKKQSEEEIASWKRKLFLTQRWGLEFDFTRAAASQGQSTVALQGSLDLPETLSWHSQLSFKKLSPEWKIVYWRQDRPALIERPMGSGTLVLASDSYFLSNEALWKDRQSRLLAWLIGPHNQVVFDETHLGVEEGPGVMSLVRKYRMHGLFASLFLLAGLFVWKNMLSLVPPSAQFQATENRVGRDSAAGFINLLRRSIPVSRVIQACVQQWEKSLPASSPERARLSQVRAVAAREQAKADSANHVVAAYQAICQVLERKVTIERTKNP